VSDAPKADTTHHPDLRWADDLPDLPAMAPARVPRTFGLPHLMLGALGVVLVVALLLPTYLIG